MSMSRKRCSSWGIINTKILTLEQLYGLMHGYHAAIVINDFYNQEWCEIASRAINNTKIDGEYRQENVRCSFLGESLVETINNKRFYFNEASEKFFRVSKIFEDSGIRSPLEMVLELFKDVWPGGAQIATESGKKYYAGIIRKIWRSPLHNDNARRDFFDWEICHILYQLSWNVFLNVSGFGQGATEIWRKIWEPSDEKYKQPSLSMMGYTHRVVEGAMSCILEPMCGQLAIINPNYYHEVHASDSTAERITMSSFIGANEISDPLIFWS